MPIELEFSIWFTYDPDWEGVWAVSFPWATNGWMRYTAHKNTLEDVIAYLEFALPAKYYGAIVKRVQ